jgi:serine/threonine protein kinase
LKDYVVMTFGHDCLTHFSKNVNLSQITILSHLGQGSYAHVYLVRVKTPDDDNTTQLMALKILGKSDATCRNFITNVEIEKKILIEARHPFVLRLHQTFQCGSFLYLMLEYAAGGSLFEQLQRNHRFKEKEVRFFASEIILALEFLHRNNILYRDLKPENVLLDSEGHVKLSDFGLSKILNSKVTNSFCGTLEYMSPEILNE